MIMKLVAVNKNGTIERLLGRALTWNNKPVELI